ncbi:hypothetical protein Nepgr_023292 [Nepenthes gracilis]|uniref:Secreted protein n=1 Tax=Nepenthes gracilis TaxID=150966 RepID=A0AAD3XYZ3_NEPGR|nr:hypothetical protein Nepgr_023292 [Nepenthes gracilis]
MRERWSFSLGFLSGVVVGLLGASANRDRPSSLPLGPTVVPSMGSSQVACSLSVSGVTPPKVSHQIIGTLILQVG